MKLFKNILEGIKPNFEKGGKLEKLYPVYDGFATFLFVPGHTTHTGAHVRAGLDLKRTMVTVILAMVPALLFGMWNAGNLHYNALGETVAFMDKFLWGAMKIVPMIVVSYGVGLGVEFIFCIIKKHQIQEGYLVSGMLIPLIMPIDIPLWMVAISVIFAVVIGKGGVQIPTSEAMEHVFGYTLLGDNSIRDWQKHSRQVTAGKNFDKTGAIGPWIVAKEAISDVDRLVMRTSLDGEDRQRGSTEDMIFSVADIVSYTSSFLELHVGDVLAMGTPAGVAMGQAEPRGMKAGQSIEMNIEGIGVLRNDVAAHSSGELND